MRLIRELIAPDLALLPIGGHFTMDPRAAALADRAARRGGTWCPIHYGTFPILAGTPAELEQELAKRGLTGVTVHAPKPGETVD